MNTVKLIAILMLVAVIIFGCGLDETEAGGTCWHENEKTCGVSGDREVVLWCDDDVWKVWVYCQEGEICTTMNPYLYDNTPMAHCEDGNY